MKISFHVVLYYFILLYSKSLDGYQCNKKWAKVKYFKFHELLENSTTSVMGTIKARILNGRFFYVTNLSNIYLFHTKKICSSMGYDDYHSQGFGCPERFGNIRYNLFSHFKD